MCGAVVLGIGLVCLAHQINTSASLLCSSNLSWTFLLCGNGTLSCWKKPWPPVNTISMKSCTWSAKPLRQVARVKVRSTWMPWPKVSQQNIAQSITSSVSCCFPLHPGAMWCKWKRDSSDQVTYFHCVQLWCFGDFSSRQGHSDRSTHNQHQLSFWPIWVIVPVSWSTKHNTVSQTSWNFRSEFNIWVAQVSSFFIYAVFIHFLCKNLKSTINLLINTWCQIHTQSNNIKWRTKV